MPVTPNFIERMILLKLHKGPGPFLDLLGGMAFKAVSVALKLDIFESLNSGPLTAAEIAHRMKASERGIQLLLNALEAIGYVKQQGGRWGYLDEAIRRGETPTLTWEWLDQHPDGWDNYNAAMMATARMADPEVIAKVKLPVTARRLLDVGGGHGLHAINFCSRYPDLSATILDWPPTRKMAEANIAAAGMDKRVSFREGDFWTDDLGSGYDVALLFNIIHMYLPDKNIELLQKVGGLIGLDLFVEVNGQTYPPQDIAGWLRQAGLTNPCEILLRKSPGFALVVGTKAS